MPQRDVYEAIRRLSSYGTTFNLEAFLESHLGDWDINFGVGIEILYFNEEQMLLEQIAQVGFTTARDAIKRRVNMEIFEKQGICSYVVARPESVIVPNVRFDVRYLAVQDPDTTRSELVIPLRLGEKVVGVLNLEARRARAFGNQDVEYFECISPLLATMIEYRLYRAEEYLIQEAVPEVSSLPDRNSIYGRILSLAMKFLGGECVGCILVESTNERSRMLQVAASYGLTLRQDQYIRTGKILAVRKALDEPSEHYIGPVLQGHDELSTRPLQSEFAVVIKSLGRIQAVLYLGSERPVFAERKGQSIQRLCNLASSAIEGVEKRTEREKQDATQEVITLVDRELHNQASLFSLIIGRMDQNTKLPADLMQLCRDFEEAIRGIVTVVKGFLAGLERTNLLLVAERAERYAIDLKVSLEVSGDFNVPIMCNKVALRWIVENLLLNSAHHAKGRRQINAWLTNSHAAREGTLTYWDNGRIDGDREESLRRLSEGASDRKGIKIVRALCDQFGWRFGVDLTPERAPRFNFTYPIKQEE